VRAKAAKVVHWVVPLFSPPTRHQGDRSQGDDQFTREEKKNSVVRMVELPSLDRVSPRLLPPEPSPSASPRDPLGMIRLQTRQTRRPTPRHVLKAQRHLQRIDMKRWCESQQKMAVLAGGNEREEKMLSEWFASIDVDRSGTVEEDEIRALMRVMDVEVTSGQVARMFASIGEPVDASLTKHQFVRLMSLHAHTLWGSKYGSTGGGLFDANTRLMMLAYRRSRLLEDVKDPSKRRNFSSAAAYNQAYNANIDEPEPELDPPSPMLPHRMLQLPLLGTPRTPRPPPGGRPRRGGPSPRAPRGPPSSHLLVRRLAFPVSNLLKVHLTLRRLRASLLVHPPPALCFCLCTLTERLCISLVLRCPPRSSRQRQRQQQLIRAHPRAW
jgi:hypothetical protein